MVVVTLESTTATALGTGINDSIIESTSTPISSSETATDECAVSTCLQLSIPHHRRTISPDKILFLKVPAEPAAAPATDSNPKDREPRKRPARDEENDSQDDRPVTKKARLVLLAPIGPAGQPRTVHFELQAADDGSAQVLIKTHVRVFERVDASEAANIWWSADEMGEIHAREKSAVSVMSFCCDHYTSQVLSVLKTARQSLPAAAATTNHEEASPASAVWVANSPARGLERDIVRGFKQRKRQVIRKVLESQRVLQTGRHKDTGEVPSLETQTRLLSTQYHKWSQPMVRFAQVLAEGDAQVVVDNNANDLNSMAPLEAF